MAINLTNGEEYTLAKIAGTAAVIDGTDHAHAIKTLRNQLHITGSSRSDGTLLVENTSNITFRPLIRLKNTNSGTSAHIYMNYYGDNGFWSAGLDATNNKFVIHSANSFAIAGSNAFELDTSGNLNLLGDLNMTDSDINNIREMRFKDFDDDAGGDDNTVRLLRRDGALALYNGAFVVGGYSNGSSNMHASDHDLQVQGKSYLDDVVYAETSNADYALQVYNKTDDASGARGILISAGESDGTTSGNTNYVMKIRDGSGDEVGYVTYVNDNLTWGSFTGVHPAYIKPDESSPILETQTASGQAHDYFKVGMIVRTVSTTTTKTGSYQPLHHITTSSIFQDKQVLGVYAGSMGAIAEENERMHQHNVWSIGDGMIYVCNENGNIEIGDYITTSSGSAGYGCKQNDDILHNYTVAKALENVDWSNESSSSKLIPCTFHCG